MQENVNLAWKVSGGNKDFILMISGEGGFYDFSHTRQSNIYSQFINGKSTVCNKTNWTNNCKREQSYGFCQVHKLYHPEIVNNPKFFNDKQFQMEKCYELFKGGTRFYGLMNAHVERNKFIFN